MWCYLYHDCTYRYHGNHIEKPLMIISRSLWNLSMRICKLDIMEIWILKSLIGFLCGMQVACRTFPDDPEALRAIDLLFDTALISSGFTVSIYFPLSLYFRYFQVCLCFWDYVHISSPINVKHLYYTSFY